MFRITVPRSDVTTEELADVLRQGLGPRYNVLPGSAVNWNPVGHPRPDHPDTIVVGPRLTNGLWIARMVRQVLRTAPSLR